MINKRTALGTSSAEKGFPGWNGLHRPDMHLLAFLVDALNRKSRLINGSLVDNLDGTFTLSGVKVAYRLASGTAELFQQVGNLVLTPGATRKLVVANRATGNIEELALPGQDPGVDLVDGNGNPILVDGNDNTNLDATENLFPLLHVGQHQDTAQAAANFCIWVAPLAEDVGGPPVGSIIAWNPGYYGGVANGGLALALIGANSIAGANAYLLPRGWAVCDGTAPNVAASPIFNDPNKHLPNLTDERFLMGGTSAGLGTSGGVEVGSNTLRNHKHGIAADLGDHAHGPGNLTGTTTTDGAHAHNQYTVNLNPGGGTGAFSWFDNGIGGQNTLTGGGHNHSVTVNGGATSTVNQQHSHGGFAGGGNDVAANNTENRPKYLSVFYIIKIWS